MKPASFEYFRPRSLDEAVSVLAKYGEDAKPLAGGQSLIPAMNFRLALPSVLVDLNEVKELAYVTQSDADVRIGGMTRQRALERNAVIAERVPLLAETMPHIAHPAIRTRGTIGGSLAHADPAAELPAVVLALGGRLRITGPGGAREVPAEGFFTGLFSTAVHPDELLTEIRIPAQRAGAGYAFSEISRRHGDFALVGVAAVVDLDASGACRSARVVLLSVGDCPVLAAAVAAVLIGQTPSPELMRAASQAATRDIDPTSDIHASAEYRRQLVEVLTRRTLERAFARVTSA